MKKYIITLTAVISSIIFVGCKKEMVQEPELDANNGGGSHYVTLTVTMPETKISHEQDGNKVIRNWEVGDIIRIDPYGGSGSKGYLKLNSTEDISDGGRTANFSGTIAELQVGEKLNIYHHKNPQGQTIANNIMLSSQTGAVEDLPEVLYCTNYEVTDTENLVVELNSILTYFHFHFDQSNKPTNFPTDDCTFKSVTLRKTSGSALLHQKVDLRYTNNPSRSEHTVGDITVIPSTPFTYSASSDWAIDFYVAAFISGSESDYTASNFQLYFNNADYVSGNDNDYADIQHLSVSWTPTKVYSTGKVYKATSANTTFTSEYVSGIVGNKDNTSGFWVAFSPYYTIPAGKTLELQFKNYSSQAAIYNNWNSVVTNDVDREGNGYSEYAVQRADTYGWGNSWSADRLLVTSEGGFVAADWWDYFKEHLNNTDVSITVEHTNYGSVLVNLRAVTTEASTNSDGYVTFIQYFTLPATTENVRFFLTTDSSHFIIQGVSFYDSATELSYLKGSDYYIANDALDLATIKGNGIDSALFGHYSWNETIQGANSHYVCEVPIDASLLTATTGTLSAVAGEQTFTDGATLNGDAVNYKANVIKGTSANGSTNLYWGDSYDALALLNSGESITKHFYMYSACEANWSCPSVIICDNGTYDGDNRDYVRLDNWVDAKGSFTFDNDGTDKANNWHWDDYKTYLNRAKVTVKVSNVGGNKATVQYGVTWLNGQSHYQNYKNIGTPSEAFYYTISMTNGYIVFVDDATASAQGWPDVTPIAE